MSLSRLVVETINVTDKLWWKIAVLKSSFSERWLFWKIASPIDNLKGSDVWRRTVPHNNFSQTNGQNLWGMPLTSFIFVTVTGRRTTQKLSRRNLLLLTCLVYVNIFLANSFTFFHLSLFIQICFGFDETKLAKAKLYGELRSVLNYNFKERALIFRLHRQKWSCGIWWMKFSIYWVNWQ